MHINRMQSILVKSHQGDTTSTIDRPARPPLASASPRMKTGISCSDVIPQLSHVTQTGTTSRTPVRKKECMTSQPSHFTPELCAAVLQCPSLLGCTLLLGLLTDLKKLWAIAQTKYSMTKRRKIVFKISYQFYHNA